MDYSKKLTHLLNALESIGLEIHPLTLNEHDIQKDGIITYSTDIAISEIENLDLSFYIDIFCYVNLNTSLNFRELISRKTKLGSFANWRLLYCNGLEEEPYYLSPENLHEISNKITKDRVVFDQLSAYFATLSDSVLAAQKMPSPYKKYTWSNLYVELIKKGNLKWADINGKKFPYVTTISENINNIGRSSGGLYFVATDIVDEPWKEEIVAYHESFCGEEGHEKAFRKEQELVKLLGKENEYHNWRTEINKTYSHFANSIR